MLIQHELAALGTSIPLPTHEMYGLNPSRVVSGGFYQSVPDSGTIGSTSWAPTTASDTFRPVLSSWGAIPTATPYMSTADKHLKSSASASAWNYLANVTGEVSASFYMRIYLDPAVAATGIILFTDATGSAQGICLRRNSGNVRLTISNASGSAVLDGGAMAANAVHDIIGTKTAAGEWALYLNVNAAVTGSLGLHVNSAANAMQLNNGASHIVGAYPLFRSWRGFLPDAAQRSAIRAAGAALYPP